MSKQLLGIYSTSNLNLAAYILCMGFPLDKTEKYGKIFFFSFLLPDNLDPHILMLNGGTVDVSAFCDAQKQLKHICFSREK